LQEAEEGEDEVEVDQTVRISFSQQLLHTLHYPVDYCVVLCSRQYLQLLLSFFIAAAIVAPQYKQSVVYRLIATLFLRLRSHLFCCCVDMQDDKYLKFYEQFGRNIKMGITEDATNRK
jgi:Hsp90 protein